MLGSVGHLTATLVGRTWPPRLLRTLWHLFPRLSLLAIDTWLGACARASFHTSFQLSFPPSLSPFFPRWRYTEWLSPVTSRCVSVVFLVSRSDGDSRFHGEDVIQNRYHSYIPCILAGARRQNGSQHRAETMHNCGE
jgi:hypothetical protein